MRECYDEIRDEGGEVRSHYRAVQAHWKSIPASKERALHARTRKLLSGDYAVDYLPRVLPQQEFRILQSAVDQRARAIRALLTDYFLVNPRWTQVIPAVVLSSIIARHHDTDLRGKLKAHQIAFPYGPDLIRDSKGQWRVLEDSAGIIGGIGDLVASRKALLRLFPEYKGFLGAWDSPQDYLMRLAEHYKIMARRHGGVPVFYFRSFSTESDHETRRLAASFEALGIPWCTSAPFARRKLVVEASGVYLKSQGSKERVGAVLLFAGPEQMSSSGWQIIFSELKGKRRNSDLLTPKVRFALRSLEKRTLSAALIGDQAWTNFSPGVQFVNDKTFGLFVDSLIRFYLKEDPIVSSLPARSMACHSQRRGWYLDQKLMRELARDRGRFVVKRVDVDGGSGVSIGKLIANSKMKELCSNIKAAPERYIVQEYEHLSVLDGRIVDLRLHAHVDSESVLVSGSPWGRANWLKGDGKVNLGSKGFISPVIVLNQVTKVDALVRELRIR